MPEKAHSEEQIRRSYECLRQLFDQAGDAIFVHGFDGRFTDVNRAACEMLGYTREEFLNGMSPWDFVVRDSRETMQQHWAAMQPRVPITVTDEVRRKDGTTFPAEVRLVRYESSEREAIIAICRDITERREAEEARARAEIAILEERSRIAREIHDSLAQSFTGILLQLEAAEAATEAGASNESYLCRVRDLARFGLAEARRSVLALRPLALEEKGLEYALRQLAERSSIEGALSCEFSASGAPQRVDPSVELGLFRIAQEAVTNAIKHANPKRIALELISNDSAVRLSISDDGSGIAIAHGRGYGLVQMQERAQQINGSLAVQTSPSEGTSIIVVVPIASPASQP